jgi:hypothetical protein
MLVIKRKLFYLYAHSALSVINSFLVRFANLKIRDFINSSASEKINKKP